MNSANSRYIPLHRWREGKKHSNKMNGDGQTAILWLWCTLEGKNNGKSRVLIRKLKTPMQIGRLCALVPALFSSTCTDFLSRRSLIQSHSRTFASESLWSKSLWGSEVNYLIYPLTARLIWQLELGVTLLTLLLALLLRGLRPMQSSWAIRKTCVYSW